MIFDLEEFVYDNLKDLRYSLASPDPSYSAHGVFFGSTGFLFFNQSECTARQCCIVIGRTFRKVVLQKKTYIA